MDLSLRDLNRRSPSSPQREHPTSTPTRRAPNSYTTPRDLTRRSVRASGVHACRRWLSHDGDNLLDLRRVGGVAPVFVARRATGVKPRHRRRRPTTTGGIQPQLRHVSSSDSRKPEDLTRSTSRRTVAGHGNSNSGAERAMSPTSPPGSTPQRPPEALTTSRPKESGAPAGLGGEWPSWTAGGTLA
jgi:hypothetical protein